MSRAHPPELRKFMDKRLTIKLNAGRNIIGVLSGFDPFMNMVMDECVEIAHDGTQSSVGMVVIRGNSIVLMESLDKVN